MKWALWVCGVLVIYGAAAIAQDDPGCAEIEAALSQCSDQIAANDALIAVRNQILQQELAQLLALTALQNGGVDVAAEIAAVNAEIARLDAELTTLQSIREAQMIGWGLLWQSWFAEGCGCNG